jgi:hypothetical protein
MSLEATNRAHLFTPRHALVPAHGEARASDHPTGWHRYVYSNNRKDIGTMDPAFALAAGVIGTFPLLGPSATAPEWKLPLPPPVRPFEAPPRIK